MPFTFAHAAAALPFRSTGVLMLALIVGTFAPDFEYFLRLAPTGGFGHTLLGAFVLDLPLALLVLWLFDYAVKISAVYLMPTPVRLRLEARPMRPRVSSARDLAWIIASMLLGIVTHIVWDSLTHPNTWPYRHWVWLRRPLHLPIAGTIQFYKLLQHGSTLFGICVLALWFQRWYRETKPEVDRNPVPAPQSWNLAMLLTVAGSVALLRATIGLRSGGHALPTFAGEAAVTFIALVWWELVAYGLLVRRRILWSGPDLQKPPIYPC